MPLKSTFKALNITNINMKEIDRLHIIPKAIVCDWDPKFISNYWRGLFREFGTMLNLITALTCFECISWIGQQNRRTIYI